MFMKILPHGPFPGLSSCILYRDEHFSYKSVVTSENGEKDEFSGFTGIQIPYTYVFRAGYGAQVQGGHEQELGSAFKSSLHEER